MENIDKLRKGLECCKATTCGNTLKDCDIACPYFHEGVFCKNALHHDSIVRIRQLESRLAQVEMERDAAVRCLIEATKDGAVCTGCRHDLSIDGRCEEADFDCKQCKAQCGCKTCKSNSNYQWRGVCDDDTEDKE